MYREESIKKNSTWSLFDYVNGNDSIIYVTPGLAYRDSLLQTGIDSESIHLIYPGIDQNVFKKIKDNQKLNEMRNRLSLNISDSVILIPCMLRKRKGLLFMAQAISKLTIPGHKIKVVLTGIPSNEEESLLYAGFRKQIGNVDVIEHERFSDEDMPILFNIASVTVLCSEAEGYGTVFLEAMACGCPVIGSDVIGINESITDRYNGILCKYGDQESLNIGIKEMLTNEEAKEKFIKNSIYKLKTRYNLHKQALDHLNLYQSICSQQRKIKFILYRNDNEKVKVFTGKKDKSVYILSATKNNDITWLEVAIKQAREISGYQVLIPNHKIVNNVDKNSLTYSFKITTNTPYVKTRPINGTSGVWLDLDKAFRDIENQDERNILQELKVKINQDKYIQKSSVTYK